MPGVPLMYVVKHKYQIERLPEYVDAPSSSVIPSDRLALVRLSIRRPRRPKISSLTSNFHDLVVQRYVHFMYGYGYIGIHHDRGIGGIREHTALACKAQSARWQAMTLNLTHQATSCQSAENRIGLLPGHTASRSFINGFDVTHPVRLA